MLSFRMLTQPNLLLRAEGGIIFAVSLAVYGELGGNWLLFVLLVLVPDVSMLGYLSNVRFGAAIYNVVHALVLPLILMAFAILFHRMELFPFWLIWTAHIGIDRLLGYGLKYPTRFQDTHLHRL